MGSMGRPNPSILNDPYKWLRTNDYAPVPLKQENVDSPRTMPFQAQVGLHESIAFTVGTLQEEAAAHPTDLTKLVKSVHDFINPPTVPYQIFLAGNQTIRKEWSFPAERWELGKITVLPIASGSRPSSIGVVIERDGPNQYTIDASLGWVFDYQWSGFASQALVFVNNDAANACVIAGTWRRLWSIEEGHGTP